MRYVSLHHHTTFSYQDGFGTPEQHIERSVELGMSSQAVTEHGNVSSYVRHEKAADAAGIKPIFGLEAYTAPDNMRELKSTRKWHLTILAMNEVGYRNLMRLVTRSWAEGFYQWPTVHGSWLAENSEGLIVLSGCADSKLACDLLGGKGVESPSVEAARRTMARFRSLLGDRFYLEVQQFPELQRTHQINQWYESEARRTGISLAATSDVHYPHPDDNKMQVILHAAGRGIGNVDTAESQWEYDIRLTHPTSDKAIKHRLVATGLSTRMALAAIDSTGEIADRCNVVLPKMPMLEYPLPREVKSKEELIWEWLRMGWRYRWSRNPAMRASKQRYVERLNYEMEMIIDKGYIDYFLMLSDAVRWAKDNSISVGPARGSAAASLACYLLRITEIDPLPFPNMLFERFIDVTRTDLPDVDLDFDDERRDELRQRMVELYGEDCVANVGTFTKYKGKNSLDDVARVNDIPPWELKPIKAVMIERSGGDSRHDAALADTFETFPEAQAVLEKYPALWNATRLEGNYKSMSVHAAGLIVSNVPIKDSVAVYTREVTDEDGEKSRRSVLSVDKVDAEYLGLLKADFLGLKTMGAISHACRMIGMSLDDLYAVPLDEPDIIDSFRRNDVVGIFQFGGGATKIVNGDVAPDNFLELCDINALSRPGPLHSGTTNDYISVKHGRTEPIHYHPIIDDLTHYTQFQIIYQEQILQVLREIGGLGWTHIQEVRKIISLKKGVGAFEQRHGDFVRGAAELHGIPEKQADAIWKRLVTAGQYAFNAAHCVSYSMLAYWTMFLKVRYPSAFYASHLRKFKDDEYGLLRDAMRHGMDIAPPSLIRSEASWTRDGSTLRGGLTQVPGIGKKNGPMLIQWRDAQVAAGRKPDWPDMVRIKGVGDKTVKKFMDFADAEDPYDIHRVDKVLAKVRKAIEQGELGNVPRPTLRGAEIPTDAENLRVVYVGIPQARNPQDVLEDERARTGDDIETIKGRMKDPELTKKMVIKCLDDSDTTVYVRFYRQTFPRFERACWGINLDHDVIVVQGKKRGGFGTGIHVSKMWVIDPDQLEDTDE